jgi:hypothetical protein
MGFRGRKIRKTIAFSLHYDVIVVMKGAPTHIIDAEKCTGILQEMRLWPQPEAGCFNWNNYEFTGTVL